MALTPAGEYFARQCQSVLSQYHGAVKQARSIADGKKQDLRLGINGPYTQESIPGYLRQFRQLYPEAAIHLREGRRRRKSWTPCSRRSWTSSWSLTMTWSWTSGLTCWS